MGERQWTAADQAWADECMAQQDALAIDAAADAEAAAKWLRKMKRTHRRCTECTDGIDGEPDGMGGAIGGTCRACQGSGWLPKSGAQTSAGEQSPAAED